MTHAKKLKVLRSGLLGAALLLTASASAFPFVGKEVALRVRAGSDVVCYFETTSDSACPGDPKTRGLEGKGCVDIRPGTRFAICNKTEVTIYQEAGGYEETSFEADDPLYEEYCPKDGAVICHGGRWVELTSELSEQYQISEEGQPQCNSYTKGKMKESSEKCVVTEE